MTMPERYGLRISRQGRIHVVKGRNFQALCGSMLTPVPNASKKGVVDATTYMMGNPFDTLVCGHCRRFKRLVRVQN